MTCQGCADNLPACTTLFSECENDRGCNEILFCWQCLCKPGDTQCLDGCLALFPGTPAALFDQWAGCVVCSCQATCGVPASDCP
jgi:hypothetical protein